MGDGNSSKPHRLRQQSTTIITAPFQFTTPWHVRWNVDYFQFTDKVPTPNKSPCPGQGMRSERSRDWNKAITFSPNSWAIRQEHWSEWRAHKMCIADCLQCSLGLLWRERSGAVSTADLGVCVRASEETAASRLSSLCLHWSSSTFEHRTGGIDKSAQSHQMRRRASSQTANRGRLKIWQKHGESFISFSSSPLSNFPCPAEPQSPRQLFSSRYVWAT